MIRTNGITVIALIGQWDAVIDCAMKFSANVCKSINNYVDEDFAKGLRQEP